MEYSIPLSFRMLFVLGLVMKKLWVMLQRQLRAIGRASLKNGWRAIMICYVLEARLPLYNRRLHVEGEMIVIRPPLIQAHQLSTKDQTLMERSEAKFLSLWLYTTLAPYSLEASMITVIFA